jgi:predicted esterase
MLMSEIKDYLDKCQNDYQLADYDVNLYNIEEPTLLKKYGTIKVVKIKLLGNGGSLVVIPGYSFKSFCSMIKKIFEGLDYIKNKYSEFYMISWSPEIKELSIEVSKDVEDEDTKFRLNEQFRVEMAHIVDKILRSPPMDINNFTLMGKSAGGGVSIYIASMNQEVKTLMLSCPGISERGRPLINRLDLDIRLSWNEDDDVIPFKVSEELINDFEVQGNKYKFYSYPTGGHELNIEFLKATM